MKRLKLSLLIVIFVISFAGSCFAATHGTPVTGGTYSKVGTYDASPYRYHVYKINQVFNSPYTGMDLSSTFFHKKSASSLSISCSISKTLSQVHSKSLNYNSTIGVDIPMVKASVSVGVGTTYSSGRQYTASSEGTYNVPIDKPTGYYKIVAGRVVHKVKIIITGIGSNYPIDEYYFDMPAGKPVIFLMYSSDNVNFYIHG